jgi:Uma2 family endonuclease
MGELEFFRGERVELIHGTVVRMSPIGPPHSSTVGQLMELLLPRLHGRATLRIRQPFVAHDESEPEPDAALVPVGNYTDHHPDRALLVIEVAESSLSYDRETKGPLYASSGVPEYWIVDVIGRVIEVYTNPESGRYLEVKRVADAGQVSSKALPDVVFSVSEIPERYCERVPIPYWPASVVPIRAPKLGRASAVVISKRIVVGVANCERIAVTGTVRGGIGRSFSESV